VSLIPVNFLTSIPEYISLAVEKNSTIAYLTICLAMFLENILPPIPSEIIMPLGGFFVFQQKLNFYILVFWGLLGTILGSLPWYYLGRLVNEKRLSNFLDKKGKYLGISSNDLNKSKKWFDKYGVSLVFWGRLVPGIRTLISVPAGIELMPLRKFLVWTIFGSLIWVSILSYAGYLFGENYLIIETYLDQIKYFVKPILILIFFYFFIRILIRFFKKNRSYKGISLELLLLEYWLFSDSFRELSKFNLSTLTTGLNLSSPVFLSFQLSILKLPVIPINDPFFT